MSAQLLVDTVIGLLAVSSASLFALIVADKFKARRNPQRGTRQAHHAGAMTA